MQWIKPKSVRQIGGIPNQGRIYVEDYVVRFAKRLAEQSVAQNSEKAAVLLGNTFVYNGEKIYQISGVVEIPGFAGRGGTVFSQSTWEKIYQEIKDSFTDLEIIGWFYSCKGFSVGKASQLLELHKNNFRPKDNVLYVLEGNEKEDRFFLYRNGQFERQKGYYIYYEKNPEMLHYMEKEASRHVHIVEQEDDRVIRNIRGIIAENEKKKEGRKGYAIGMLVAAIGIIVGISLFKNQDMLTQVKEQVNHLQELALEEQKQEQTTIETIGSDLVKTTATPVAVTSAAVTQSAVAK